MASPGQAATQLTSSGIKDQEMNRNDSCVGITIFLGEKKNRWIRFSVIKDQEMNRNDSCVGITISPYAPTREGPMLQNKDTRYCQVC